MDNSSQGLTLRNSKAYAATADTLLPARWNAAASLLSCMMVLCLKFGLASSMSSRRAATFARTWNSFEFIQ